MLPIRAAKSWCALSLMSSTLCLALLGCAPSTPPGATASGTYSDQATLTVTGIDKTKRLITVQDSSGQSTMVQASNDVRNFDQLRVGDIVHVAYEEQIRARVRGVSAKPIDGVIIDTAVTRASKGQKPEGAAVVRADRSVEIISVDRTSHTVTFRETDGSVDSFVVQNPQNYPFVDGLQPGTIVDVTETAGLAASVTKM